MKTCRNTPNHDLRLLTGTALLLTMVLPAWAHDLILKPMDTQVSKGDRLPVHLMLTESYLKGDHIPAADQVKVHLFDPVSETRSDIRMSPNEAEKVLSGVAEAPGPQMLMITAERAGRYRSKTPEGNKPVPKTAPGASETVYSEAYAKTLINLDRGNSGYEKPAGLRLEILPLENPALLKPSGSLPVKILFEGAPVQSSVQAVYDGYAPPDDGHPFVTELETGDDGVAAIPVSRRGLWMIRARYMKSEPTETYDRYSAKSVMVFEVK